MTSDCCNSEVEVDCVKKPYYNKDQEIHADNCGKPKLICGCGMTVACFWKCKACGRYCNILKESN